MRGSARRQAQLRQRALVVVSAAFMVTTGILPSATPAAATEIPSPGVVTVRFRRPRTAPVYLRQVTPVEISTATMERCRCPGSHDRARAAARRSREAAQVATEIPRCATSTAARSSTPTAHTPRGDRGRMNYQAPDGSWKPEDLSLTTDAAGAYDLQVKASDRVVRFGSTDAQQGLASISADGHAISIRAIGYGAADARAADDNRLSFAGSGANGQVFAVPTDMGFEFGVTSTR